MLRLKGWRTEHVEIEVHVSDVIDKVIGFIKKQRKLENVDELDEKGRMCEHVEYATTHSWINKEDRGKPTKEQKEALKVLEFLHRIKREEVVK